MISYKGKNEKYITTSSGLLFTNDANLMTVY